MSDEVKQAVSSEPAKPVAAPVAGPLPCGLDPTKPVPVTLRAVEKYNHDSSIFVFNLPNPNEPSNLSVSSAVLTFTKVDGKDVMRPYTPIDHHEKGVLKLLVKIYPNGAMGSHLSNMKIGDVLMVKGPMPKKPYIANSKKEIGMIAGGSGITPMLQILENIITNPNDNTKVSLLFANRSTDDILLRERLDKYAETYANKLKVYYTVDRVNDNSYKGFNGHINADMLRTTMPAPSNDNLIYVCGPPGLMNLLSGQKPPIPPFIEQGELTGLLKDLNYTKEQVYKF